MPPLFLAIKFGRSLVAWCTSEVLVLSLGKEEVEARDVIRFIQVLL